MVTLKDFREAILYISDSESVSHLVKEANDDVLEKFDFWQDLHMGNVRILNVVIQLERTYNLNLPIEVYKKYDGTVGSLRDAINSYIN